MKACAFIAAVCMFQAGIASAVTLFSNTGQALGGSGGGSNFLNTNYRYATDFTTNGLASTITGGSFQVANLDSITHSFTMSIYTDNSGTPQGGTLVGTFNAGSVAAGSFPGTPTSITAVTPFNLAANTTYWEVLQMDESGVGAPQDVYTSNQTTDAGSLFTTVPSTALKFSTDGGTTFSDVTVFSSPIQGNDYFSLTGTETVPEPSRSLLGLVALGMMMMRRRRQN